MIRDLSLREWQRRALELWKGNAKRGIVSAVTGGGKTRVALACLDHYRNSVPAATALIVVPTNALLDQWIDQVIHYFGIPLEHLHVLAGHRPPKLSRINLGVINTAAMLADNALDFPLFLIVDECHRAASDTFRKVFCFKTDASLGLSATPERPYDDGLASILVPNLGPVLIEYKYEDALRDGVIVPFELHNVVFDFEPELREKYDKMTKSIQIAARKFGQESPEVIRLLLRRSQLANSSPSRIRIAARIVARNKDRRIMVFHEDISACEILNKALSENGVRSTIYHSKLRVQDRIKALQDFRSGNARCMIACRALDEGFDVPEAELAIVAASTATYRQRIQRLGRVLRPLPGKQRARIFSIVASEPEQRRLAEEAQHMQGLAEVLWIRE